MEVQVALVAILSSLVKTFNKIEIFKFGAQKEATKQVDKIVEFFLKMHPFKLQLFLLVFLNQKLVEKERREFIFMCVLNTLQMTQYCVSSLVWIKNNFFILKNAQQSWSIVWYLMLHVV